MKCLEHFASIMEKHKIGIIIGISSVAGERGRASNYIYGSAKAGLSNYLSGLRVRMAKVGVNVLTVLPGFVDTKMTQDLKLPKKLTASSSDVAQSIYKNMHTKGIIYYKPIWKYIMLVIKLLPDFVFKRINF